MSIINRQQRLAHRPEGPVRSEDFDLIEQPVPDLKEGEVLVRVAYLAMDPTLRVWMRDIPQYMPPVAIGEVMRCHGIGRVVQSRSSQFGVGDVVQGMMNWQDYVIFPGDDDDFVRLPPEPGIPLPTLIGACGMSGVTAYYGLTDIAPVSPGETLVVSSAAGSVGAVAGQIGKIRGARVVGIAGGPEKCRYIVEELGFDAAVDYKSENWKESLLKATPDGIHVDFEAVGGEIMHTVMSNMVLGGRVALCGVISTYQGAKPSDDFSVLIIRRLTVRGFLVGDYKKTTEAVDALSGWFREGRLKAEETVAEGLEHAPVVLNRLFDGSHRGKLVLQVDPQA